ncbi:TPA: relaxase/mobilization nuclease domain-containing protein [Legionella pneumophila]|uniref:Relaxase/mobilization nuclease domain-containing protein n=1 Tax=Legionella pneumophila TaxID=446 RepID=A0AAP9BY78_LEGPN|nr:TraI/MobA(P) family conjugative relaxase [Legionella pneumophila]HCC3257042.1 relaxase/mobilization nuclease domain-containing protein [Legionella pneumophila subsp. pneumophila]AMV15208.1 Relaxase/Mobilization nuclease domain protein [Legionella pneumophila]MBN5929869.1 relaxase/mobilization nuclease domain-containing protein [Legionella pneumophila]PYB44026.1 conjugal transfer protein TraI [Legionella pneumophila]PYB49879.1 conjugal transfer protein TraI [Legionella pneumophila]
MIIRHIPMKKTRLSSFSGLVQYLCNQQNKQERVGKIRLSNCTSFDPIWAVQEVLATQAKNQRATGDKTYHMLISFAPGENPTAQVLQEIEDTVASSIGFKEHQRISVVHHDTDNLHIHVAINKIHPQTFNMMEPFRAYKIFAEVASKLEIELGLQITNHQTRKNHSENLADDMEHHSGIESLINWMKRYCKEKIEAASSWKEIHSILAGHGLIIRIKANGFVFCNVQGLTVKASSISRTFSKKNLESKLGSFVPSYPEDDGSGSNVYNYEPLNKKVLGSALYAKYQHEKSHNKCFVSDKLKKLREARTKLIEKAKKRGRIKRVALKLMNLSKAQKKYLYQHINKTLLNEIENIRKNYAKERSQLLDSHQNKTWADWLKQKAQGGDQDALMAMRYRNRKNKHDYTISGSGSSFSSLNFGQIDSVTKEGTEIYKKDNCVIRDNGKEIIISKGGSIHSLKKALEMARQRYGDCICVNGSPLFKKIILQTVIQYQMPITFADLDLENQRQKLNFEQEKSHEQSRSNRQSHRGRTSGGHEAAGTAPGNRKGSTKPNAFSIRHGSPAKDHNSLRNLSKCDLVQLTGGGQVLLQDNAHDQLERQGFKPDNDVRRKIFGLNQKDKSRKQ